MNDPMKEPRQRDRPRAGAMVKTDRQMCILRFSPCGGYLVAGGSDGRVHRWSVSGRGLEALAPLEGHGGWVQALAFHPDGRRLVTADSWGRVCCWPFQHDRPEPLWSIPQAHDGWIRALAVSPEGLRLATCGRDGAVRVGSPDDFRDAEALPGPRVDTFALAFHPDGLSLVAGDLDGVVRHWDLETGACRRELDAHVLHRLDRLQDVGGVRALAFDPLGRRLACAGTLPKNGGNVQGVPAVLFFDWESGRLEQTLTVGNDGDGFVYDLQFHPEGFIMGVTSGNPGTGKLFFHRPGDQSPFFLGTSMANCHSLALHPAGRRLAVSATNANSNGNGRKIGGSKEYPGNWSPIHLWELPATLA